MASANLSGPTPPSETVRRQMQAQRTSGTKIEIDVRRKLHAKGIRYRVDAKLLPKKRIRGDIVWSGRKIVVFMDGCFWHGCPLHSTTPTKNRDWWIQKLSQNRTRDRSTDLLLREAGWTVLRFWEHEDTDKVVETIIEVLQ